MKTLFIQDGLINAGAERSHMELLARFSENMQTTMVYFYPHHDLRDSYLQKGIALAFLGLPGAYSFIRGIYRLCKLIGQEKPDLLVSCLLRSNLMARAASLLTGVPLVGTLVSDSYGEERIREKKAAGGFWKFRLFWLLDRWTASVPVHWISNAGCLTLSHAHTLGINPSKVSVVYRGRSVETLPYQRKIPTTSFYQFISYGRFLRTKGFQELIQAFAHVQAQYPHARLTIYGDGEYRAPLVQLVEQLGLSASVSLPGKHPRVHEKLHEADCFVFPSWYEGFSGALVEAMLSGIPIIASDIPMNLEAVSHEVNALVFPVKNTEALAQCMKHAIENPEIMLQMGEKAREEAIQRFDIEHIARQYEAVLHQVYQNTQRK